MKIRRFFGTITLAALALPFFTNCDKDEFARNSREIPEPPCPAEKVTAANGLILRFDYENYEGAAPSAYIVENETDPEILFGADQVTPTLEGDKMVIRIPNIRINDGSKNYVAKCMTIEEFDPQRPAGDQWFTQTEFKNSEEFVELQIAAVLALDVSSSLGDDREAVKQMAVDFARRILAHTNNKSYVGLVIFADKIYEVPLTNNIGAIEDAIAGFPYPDLSEETETVLFDGMDRGLQMLANAQVNVIEKVLVTFTDGNDNGSDNPAAKQQNIRNSQYLRYMIGLRGKGQEYNSALLESLATHPSQFVEADNTAELEDQFNNINELIANLYTVIYRRSDQKFSPGQDDPIKIRAVFFATPFEL